ncbi:ABC-2 type transport system ATP-binding protein [Kineothrix alysoides]|uniref:ABC-2 type transport system ATP-binding protein n=1 Tax=Kineothrix alysoides TaxID=1469948 RepID=A0A4R1R020_9FIRM|nr:ABC transporter ATP-binding protein [Kineothrix alysoides]TCL58601.1 ABC-2 type transport system ATP-binding protein [Kineothrix alysoides]
MIEVENLVKKYGGHTAVDHLNFHVEKGQIYGFLGPNGAGKSTTMNIMTGYLAATEGNVKINGYDILTNPEEAKKCIGYLPEFPPLYPEMTVYEYLKFVAELKKIPKEERKKQIEEVMNMTMVTDVSKRLIKNLSKGYKQRVGLAQAILGYPEVIILDEPTVGLDPKQIIEIRDLIRKLGENHTVILSSHILSEVSAVCDHIMIISKGKLVASDSPEGLQKLKTGTADLNITVLGKKEDIQRALNNIAGVKEISYIEKEDAVEISITTFSDTDISREAGIALAENKLPVIAMSRQAETLEDIFLQLTSAGEGKAVGSARDDEGNTDDKKGTEIDENDNTDDENNNDEEKEAVKITAKVEENEDDSNI